MSLVESDLELLADPFKARAYRLVDMLAREGLPFRVFETRRSFARSQVLYMQGRTYDHGVIKVIGPTVSNAHAGESGHNWGLALDAILITKPDHAWYEGHSEDLPRNPWDMGNPLLKLAWDRYGRCVRACDLEWGGGWKLKDFPHAEYPRWEQLRPSNWKDVVQRELAKQPAV